LLGTTHPIVAVVSGSMEHDGSFDDWWGSVACESRRCTQSAYYNEYNITRKKFLEFKFKNGFNKGDIMVLKGGKPEKINVGDIIVFKSNRPDPIIHRVIKKWEKDGKFYFQTKGDHNLHSYPEFGEESINEDNVIGKAVVRIPYLGWIKIIAVKIWTLVRPR
jgi:signal peptidase I